MSQESRMFKYMMYEQYVCTVCTVCIPDMDPFKGLSHEIFTVIFLLEWIYLGLNGNRFWFSNFKEGSSILYSYFKNVWYEAHQNLKQLQKIEGAS